MLKASDNPPALSPRAKRLEDLTGHWWVAHTKPRFEKALAFDLLQRDIGYFLPMIERASVSGGRKRRALIPLFTSYLFFCGSHDDRHEVLRTGRIVQVINVAAQAQLVGELAAIDQVLSANHNRLELHRSITGGQRCRITSGTFQGIEGLVVHCGQTARIVLQVTMLGQGALMEIDADLLEPVSHDQVA